MTDCSPFGRLDGERAANFVARRLGTAILRGEIAPGTRLREETLAKSYAVSRTPIREALIQLSASGLVALERNRGATVLQLSRSDVTEIYDLRSLLEAEAAARAATRATPEIVDELFEACNQFRGLRRASASEQLAVDNRFHSAIAAASGSKRLFACVRQVAMIPEAYRASTAYSSQEMIEAEGHHRAIASAIRDGKRADARRVVRRHVEWAKNLALERLHARLSAD